MRNDTDRVLIVLLTDVSDHLSVVVRNEEVYLCEDVIDHLIDLPGRHSLGILCGLNDIRAKSLYISGKRILRLRRPDNVRLREMKKGRPYHVSQDGLFIGVRPLVDASER